MSTDMVLVIGVLAVIQISLLILALVTLVKTPRERLTLPLPAWLVIVVLISWIGPIAFLVAGRHPKPVTEDPGTVASEAIDDLYK